MPQEIERKFLVDINHPELQGILSGNPIQIKQGYLKSDASGVVRVRTYGELGYLAVKGPTKGISRQEFEYQIPKDDAEQMLETLGAMVLKKARYLHQINDGPLVEVDVFHQIDLVVAEVELPSETSTFDHPDWLLDEVSHDPSYFNNVILESLISGDGNTNPELETIMTSLIHHRNECEGSGKSECAERTSDTIATLKRHPYFKAKTEAALCELAALDQEFEKGGI